MNREEQKYLIALGNLQNMAIDNTKGSKAVEICTNDIRTYVERLNNIINGIEKYINEVNNMITTRDIKENVYICGRYDENLDILDKLNELKGDNK